MTSNDILVALRKRHKDDVFVEECKNGRTFVTNNLLRLDAWVLQRTYHPLTTIGYEIKVSRSDFEQDQKWTGYLDLCHMFYFVCPAKLIVATDIPMRCGLIWVSNNGTLHTKRKPQRVDPNIVNLNSLMTYVLMSRCRIVANMYAADVPALSRIDAVRRLVENAVERKKLASFVRGHIRDVWTQIGKTDIALHERERQVVEFTRRLAQLGINWDAASKSWQDTLRVDNEITALKQQLPLGAINQMRDIARQLVSVCDTLDKLHTKE